jgi:hypothetical protein
MSATQMQVQILGTLIRENPSKQYCINDLFRASGSSPKDRPSEWLKLNKTKQFIAYADKNSKDGIPSLCTNQVVIEGSAQLLTYSSPVVFLEYAGWLSVKVRYSAYVALLSQMVIAKEQQNLQLQANNSNS